MRKFLAFLLIIQTYIHAKELIDLEKLAQSFVLETKQITIPGFAGAFNPSITRWRDSLLLCFRVRNDKMISTFEIGFVWLDKNFNQISAPRILDVRSQKYSTFNQNQDPRLITIKDQLYIVYSNFIKIDQIVARRMFVAQVHYKDDNFFINDPACLHSFEGSSSRWEKNWVPFTYYDNLLLAYSILPHRILRPSIESGRCETVNTTASLIHWDWGELRGGTPALLDGDEYLAFFHSSKNIATTHSQGVDMPHYVMGAYTFSASPPFEVTRISPEPIVGKDFYSAPPYNTWKPLRVVFPGGYVMDDQYVWVVYGRQDFELWIAKLDKKALYKSLIPCPQQLISKRCEIEPDNVFDDIENEEANS